MAAPPMGIAFLLTQLGTAAAEQFAAALTEHDLTPPLVGMMHALRAQPGISQQELAAHLGMVPSRIVAFVDDLEGRGWVSRTRDSSDRRVNLLTLTDAGEEAFGVIAGVARTHERRVTSALSDDERTVLAALLHKLADARGLTPGVHPGYRRL
jgi:DNA-binding MarR family transcriptional regulator